MRSELTVIATLDWRARGIEGATAQATIRVNKNYQALVLLRVTADRRRYYRLSSLAA